MAGSPAPAGASMASSRGGVTGQAGLPRLLGPERGGRLPVDALGDRRASSCPPGTSTARCACCPTGASSGATTPRCPASTTSAALKPYKQPPDGEELDEPNGSFSGQTLYVPGPYKMPGETIGSDSPPTPNGVFNNNQTYTGCAVDRHRNVLRRTTSPPRRATSRRRAAAGWSSGSRPTTRRTASCTARPPGGYGPHHTDGNGGLAQPGMMALARNGDLLVPNVGTSQRAARSPTRRCRPAPPQCPGGVYPRSKLQVSTFVKASFPAGVAEDPTCDCYAVSSYIGDPSIVWVRPSGNPSPDGAPVPGTHGGGPREEPRPVQPLRHGLRPGRDPVLRRHPHRVHGPADRLRPGELRGPGHAGDHHQRPALGAGDGGERVRLPDERDGVRPGHRRRCPYPTGTIKAPLSGPSENPAPDKGPVLERAGHGRASAEGACAARRGAGRRRAG